MTYETLLLERRDGVATITLNRPERLNAFNRAMTEEVRRVWRELRTDDDVRAVVLRAAGDRAFCTGADVQESWRAPSEREKPFEMDDPGEWLGPKQNQVWKPVICAVNGMCAGGAFYFLNESDIIICSETATFFDPHVTYGLVAAVEPVGALRRVPLGEIMRMTLLGNSERLSAQTALRISLVTEVTPPDQLWSRADELARTVATFHPVAIQGSVRALWEALSLPHAAAVSNALKYTQIGNPISSAAVSRSAVSKAAWTLR